MKEVIEYLARHLVDHPECVVVEEEHGEDRVIVTLRVAKPDVGKIIGKNGQMAYALRTITVAVGKKAGIKASLKMQD